MPMDFPKRNRSDLIPTVPHMHMYIYIYNYISIIYIYTYSYIYNYVSLSLFLSLSLSIFLSKSLAKDPPTVPDLSTYLSSTRTPLVLDTQWYTVGCKRNSFGHESCICMAPRTRTTFHHTFRFYSGSGPGGSQGEVARKIKIIECKLALSGSLTPSYS